MSCWLCLCLAAMLARLFRGNTVVPRSHGCLLSQPELHTSVATVDEHVVWAPVRDLAGAALALESDAPPHGWTGTPSPATAVALLASLRCSRPPAPVLCRRPQPSTSVVRCMLHAACCMFCMLSMVRCTLHAVRRPLGPVAVSPAGLRCTHWRAFRCRRSRTSSSMRSVAARIRLICSASPVPSPCGAHTHIPGPHTYTHPSIHPPNHAHVRSSCGAVAYAKPSFRPCPSETLDGMPCRR